MFVPPEMVHVCPNSACSFRYAPDNPDAVIVSDSNVPLQLMVSPADVLLIAKVSVAQASPLEAPPFPLFPVALLT